jgi:putative peptidoglycan lipid II flippase
LKNKSLLSSGILIVLLVVFGKLIAFGKDVVISGYFGATSITDAYFVANSVPTIIFTAFYSTVSLVFLPLYNNKRLLSGDSAADNFASNVINFNILISAILSFLGIYFAEEIIRIIAPSFDSDTMLLSIKLTKILCLSFVFSISVGILSTIQYVRKQYISPQFIPIINNSIVLVSIFFLARTYGIFVVAVSGVIAWVFQVLIQINHLKKEFHYSLKFNIRDADLKEMVLMIIPVFISLSIDQVNVLINTTLGSGLIDGSISALNYASRLMSFSSGMFIMVVTTLMYPIFSDLVVKKQFDQLNLEIAKSLRVLSLIAIPLMIIIAIYHIEIVIIVYERGQFSHTNTLLTSGVLVSYSIAIIFIAFREILNRIFYSFQDSKTPLTLSIVSIIINIIFSLLLVSSYGAIGLALSTSISTIVYCFLQFRYLKKKIGNAFYKNLNKFLMNLLPAIISMSIVVFCVSQFIVIEQPIIKLLVGSVLGMMIYTMTLYFMKIEEAHYLLTIIIGYVRRMFSTI